MYIVHLTILILFLLPMLLCVGVRLPSELSSVEVYFIPFYKLAAAIAGLAGRLSDRSSKKTVIGRELMLINPAGKVTQLVRSFEIKRLGGSLMVLFIGNLLALLVCLSAMSKNPLSGERAIERNGYGDGEKSVVLDVFVDGQEALKGEELHVPERHFTKEEIEELFLEITERLERAALGENESMDMVCRDMRLMTEVEGYPISVEWELSNYGIMDSEGHLKAEKIPEEGCVQRLTATLRYGDVSAAHSFNAVVYPPRQDEEQELSAKVRNEIRRFDEATLTDELSVLPGEIDGHRITYKPPASKDSLLIFLLIAIAAAGMFKLSDRDLQREIKKRDTQMMIDYPQIVSKLTLLIGAGMTVIGAFTKLAADYEKDKKNTGMRFAYEEMLITVREISGGVSEADAYVRFGNRCRIQKFVKLGAMLSQNIKRGSAGLLEILESEERDAFEERKALARRLGEEAGTKLLAPMGIMLVIVMVIVIFPAFSGFEL